MNIGSVLRSLRRFARAGEAVSAFEYAILVGIVVAVVAGAVVAFSGNVTTAIDTLGTAVGALSPPASPKLSP